MKDVFASRTEAGRLLAHQLVRRKWTRPVVLALPRGGVPVALEVARTLHAPLDVLIVRRISGRDHPELAVAAVAEGAGDHPVLDLEAMELTRTYRAYVEARARAELGEIARRRAAYLGHRVPIALDGMTAIVVDDGLARGTTARAAVRAVRERKAASVVLAVPVASRAAVEAVLPDVDALVCLSQPAAFGAVGVHYAHFQQVSDEEVIAALSCGQGVRRSHVFASRVFTPT
jgi:putative phosphoribosyl transferase